MSDTPRAPHRMVGYVGSLTAFTAISAGLGLLIDRSSGRWPARYRSSDLAIGAVAIHKLSRIITKEGVTTPLRAPFTEFEGADGSAEVSERPRHGAFHVPGELLTCPFCIAPWLATFYVAGLALVPGPTRALAAVFAAVAGSDVLQHTYARIRQD